MTNNSIRINRSNSTIEVLATFEKKARIYDSDEYKLLEEVCNAHPTFNIVVIKHKPSSNSKVKNLTYDKMGKIITKHKPDILDEFNKLAGLGDHKETEKGLHSYGEVRQWFLNQFPEMKKVA